MGYYRSFSRGRPGPHGAQLAPLMPFPRSKPGVPRRGGRRPSKTAKSKKKANFADRGSPAAPGEKVGQTLSLLNSLDTLRKLPREKSRAAAGAGPGSPVKWRDFTARTLGPWEGKIRPSARFLGRKPPIVARGGLRGPRKGCRDGCGGGAGFFFRRCFRRNPMGAARARKLRGRRPCAAHATQSRRSWW